jgi:penicillin-binding protein 1A
VNSTVFRWLRMFCLGALGLALAGIFALLCSYVYLAPSLPTSENAQLAPLQIYTRTGGLISRIGEQHRNPVTYDQIPEVLRHAALAAEDDRFFEHGGIDWMGIARAFATNIVSADATGQGGSTITQQAARNMFLTRNQTARRKLSEIFVAYRMERNSTKEEIFAIYLNVAEFGHRSVGVAAAANTYYNKRLDQLTVSQAATLIGLLPAPSKYNPITNPRAAEVRRGYVLGRMLKLGYIDEATLEKARKEPVATRGYAPMVDVEADYVGEMVRLELVKLMGDAAVNKGYKVFTTLDGRLQASANRAVRVGLLDYDRRYGYRGKLGKVAMPTTAEADELESLLSQFDSIGPLLPAVVTQVGEKTAQVHVRGVGAAKIDWAGLQWARPASKSGTLGAFPSKAADVLAVGDVVHVVTDKHGAAELAQMPRAQSALVALDPVDGGVVALVGGFDYHQNKFNRAKQAKRQPGSSFKPFVYSAALDSGLTAATAIPNLPLPREKCDDEECWNPENSGGGFGGILRLREGLVWSKNLIAIRILDTIGVEAAIEHASKFGFRKDTLPRNLTLALGTQSASPYDMATGYATFANGGFKVEPYLISRIVDATGKVVFEAKPKLACLECERASVPEPIAEIEPVADALEPAEDAAAPVVADDASGMIAAPPAPSIRDVDAPPALRDLARSQGGSGLLPADRLAPRVISIQNAWLMTDILHDVATRGTARRSVSLGRNDLAGKTGTTQKSRDNWFNGFNHQLVASVWVGADDETPLGESEEGSRTALPIWMLFMKEALRKAPESRLERPGGLIDLRVSPNTGTLADPSDPSAVFEIFMVEHQPPAAEGGAAGATPGAGGTKGDGQPLF